MDCCHYRGMIFNLRPGLSSACLNFLLVFCPLFLLFPDCSKPLPLTSNPSPFHPSFLKHLAGPLHLRSSPCELICDDTQPSCQSQDELALPHLKACPSTYSLEPPLPTSLGPQPCFSLAFLALPLHLMNVPQVFFHL